MKRLLTAAAALTLLSMTAAHAGARATEAELMDACIHQYVSENLADYQGKVTVNKLGTSHQALSLNTQTQIMVSATHRTSGEDLGTVVCNVSRDGKVTVAAPTSIAAAKLSKLNKTAIVASNSAE